MHIQFSKRMLTAITFNSVAMLAAKSPIGIFLMGVPLPGYLQKCITHLEAMSELSPPTSNKKTRQTAIR